MIYVILSDFIFVNDFEQVNWCLLGQTPSSYSNYKVNRASNQFAFKSLG